MYSIRRAHVMRRLSQLIVLSMIMLLISPDIKVFGEDSIDEYIDTMTVREKIGQIMMIGFMGNSLNNADIEHIQAIRPGGIVFYKRNIKDISDISTLTESIQNISMEKNFPMLFAIDQEGGIVHRIEGRLYRPPSAPAIGAANSKELAKDVGLSVGNSLKKLGININFAPVLDVPNEIASSPMRQRSFSNNVDTVATLGSAYIKGLRKAGVLSTAKHFPGIGRTTDDTHKVLPLLTWHNQHEREKDLYPFKTAVENGVDCIMVGHILAEPGDRQNPVSLSSYWLTEVLRDQMGFNGLIIVDNLEMKPIAKLMSVPEAAVRSFRAGADIILVTHERSNQKEVFKALWNAVQEKTITMKRLDESLGRILRAKSRIKTFKNDSRLPLRLLDVSRSVAEQSVVSLKMKGLTDFKMKKKIKVLYVGFNALFYKMLYNHFEESHMLNTTLPNFTKMYSNISLKEFLQGFDAVILDTGYRDLSQIILLCKDLKLQWIMFITQPWTSRQWLTKYHPERGVIVFDSDILHYGAAVEVLSGKRKARGIFPYSGIIPDIYTY